MGPFLPIYSTNKPKNQNFEKMKKTPGGIIILHLSTTNDNRIMYGSWEIEFNKQNLFSFWITFCPFTEKSKFSKKKTPRDIISLHLYTTNDNHMMYGYLDIRCNRQNFLWTIFCLFNTPPPPPTSVLKTWKIDIFIK